MSDPFPLPSLRQELRIDRGAPLPSGAPGYILFDPLRHLFFQLGALEQRVAAHWNRGEAGAVREALIAEGEHEADAEDAIVAFHDFALANSLTQRPAGDTVATLAGRHAAAKRDWWKWLLDHYLFVRVPLVRPAGFLRSTLPTARKIWSRTGITILATMALIGLFLVTRQWDAFTGSFAGLLTAQGLFAYACALFVVKIFHELGHAYTATRNGAHVPTMGVSFLVMVPVLYTDTSAAWRLNSRRKRMTIDAAGLIAEFSVAAVAIFLWSFLPDGPIRTAAFILATTSLATSLLVNASPFMRFDGYYILADLLGVPNLAPRSFAILRWHLREALFDLGEAPPEDLPRPLRRAMLTYACVTFVYRTMLYVGIALLVYHSFFKALGIVLFAVEVSVFLARPVLNEMKEWRRRQDTILANRRTRWVAAGGAVLVVAAFLPLDRSVSLPALLTPIVDTPIVTGNPALVEHILVANGAQVRAGQPLMILSSPDLTLGIAQANLRIAQLQSQIARGVADRDDLADATVLQRDLAAERDRLAGFQRRQAALTVRATIAGRVVDLPTGLAPGSWTDGRAPLLRVVTPGQSDVRAYLPEGQSWRIEPGIEGRFVPDEVATASWAVRLDEIGASAVETLGQPMLASVHGGPIETADGSGKSLKPRQALIALRLIAERRQPGGFVEPVSGRVILPARGDSLAAKVARAVSKVLVRDASLQ